MIQSMMIGHVIQIYTVKEMQPLVKYDMHSAPPGEGNCS